MPTTRKRRRRRPLPADFAAISKAECIRWGLGHVILIEHNVSLMRGAGSSSLTVWPSWSAWRAVYSTCRRDYLTHYRARHPFGIPGAERLYEAHLAGGDDGAEAVREELRQEERRNDPRLRLLREMA